MAVNSFNDPGLHNEVYYVGTFNTSTTEPFFVCLFQGKMLRSNFKKKEVHTYLLVKLNLKFHPPSL